MRRIVPGLSFLICAFAVPLLNGEILSSAMLAFPAKTESLEYDNLSELRRLPNYTALKKRFAGAQLEDAQTALKKLNVSESEVHELVMGTSATAFYGLLSGTFSGSEAQKAAKKAGIWPHMIGREPVYCPKGAATCVVFLEDSLAAFGSLKDLNLILETRIGVNPQLLTNRSIVALMNSTPARDPVRGVVYGSQLTSVITDALHDGSGMNIDWKPFSANINAFAYSVVMDSRAHVTAKVLCKSATTAGVLRQMLGALNGVESVATKVGKDPDTMPFQNLQVSVSGEQVDLKMDTPVPIS